MADKEKKETKIGSNISNESVKVMAESMGITSIPDEASACLSADVTYRLKQITQVGLL